MIKKQIKMDEQDKRKWKVLDSEYLFKRPWLTVRCETVQLPNGIINKEYYILEYPDWINIIALTKENQFIFIRQYRHGIQQTNYELCAGVCEKNEPPLVSAQRELLEETGYGKGDWKEYMVISANPSTMTNVTHCFIATGLEKIAPQQLEDTEDLTVHLLSIEEVKELLISDQIKQSLHAAPLWKYIAENHLI